jgi:hypothetical protein
MDRRAVLPVGLVAAVLSLACPPLIGGQFPQFPEVPERCLLPPVPKKHSAQSHPARKVSGPPEDEFPERSVLVEGIRFDGPVHLPDSVVTKILKELNKWEVDIASDSDGVKAVVETELKEAWLDRGYFKVELEAEPRSLSLKNGEERFLVLVHVNEGLQYHLRNIRFTADNTIPEAELRRAVPLRDGEVLRVAAIREGIGSLTKLYGSRGFIDFVAVTDTQIDDGPGHAPWISISFNLDREKQYRTGDIKILGSNQKLEIRLKSIVKRGEVFNWEAVDRFFKDYQSALPGISWRNDLELRRDVDTGTVDLVFDFRPCPVPE